MPLKFYIFILSVLNIVGIVGISIPSLQAYLLPFTPLNLSITLFLIFLNQRNKNIAFYGLCAFVFCFGLLIEILGVQTGLIFGSYEYGTTLGWKVKGTPPMIGVNWLLCILSVGSLLHYLKINKLLKIVLGASLLVALDYVIEPVAIKLNFWQWENNIIPLQNYAAWWIISAAMLTVYYALSFEKENRLAVFQFLVFILFFGILNFTLL